MNLALFNRDVLAQHPALLNELDQLIARINHVHGVEHDPQTGEHTNLTAESLTWAGAIQATVGAAGAAAALPANPIGYLEITVGSTAYVVPFYAKS